MGYLPSGVGRILIIASAGGAPNHPDWFHNLVANTRVTVEDGVSPTSGPPNAASWGAALKLIHDAFRRELALIRKETRDSLS